MYRERRKGRGIQKRKKKKVRTVKDGIQKVKSKERKSKGKDKQSGKRKTK